MTATTNLDKLEELRQQVSTLQRFALEDPRQLEPLLPAILANLQGSLQELGAAGSNGKHVEDQRLDHAKRFRSMSDQGQVLVRIMGSALHCRWVNRAWLGFTGRSTKDLLGEGWLRHMQRDDREHYVAACYEACASGRIYSMEYRLQRTDGEYGWVREIGSPQLDARGRIRGFVGVATEISEPGQSLARPELQVALDQILTDAAHTGANGHNGNQARD